MAIICIAQRSKMQELYKYKPVLFGQFNII